MRDGLHIIVLNNSDQNKFDASFGSLTLQKAGSFKIKVREYEEAFLKKQKKTDEALTFAETKWRERAKEGWSREKLEENWKANERERNASEKVLKDELEKKFADVNWVWTVAPKKLTPSDLSHNDSFSVGIKDKGEYNIKFPKILEGGGMAYLEAFFPTAGAKGAKPFGVFVKATGVPRIVRVEWTDFNYNLLKDKVVAFNSEVLLHIYTEGLYGQEVEINLFDEDTFSDDELNIDKKSAFQREVNIYKVHPKEIGKPGVADTLVKADQDKTDLKVDKEQYLQKITVEVKVDYGWMKLAGKNLKIYPTVKSIKTGNYFENFSREFLEVGMNGTLYDVQKEVTNMPVLQSEIETNIAAYHPCKYLGINLNVIPETDKETNRTIFKENNTVSPDLYEIPIICPDTDHFKDYAVALDSLETKECRFDGKTNDHETKSLTVTKIPENFKVSGNDGKTLNFKAAFNYHPGNDNIVEMTSLKMLEFIWPVSLPSDNKHSLEVRALSCRYEKTVKILAYPDVKWALDFRFGMKGPEQYTHTNLPTYPRNSDPEKVDKNPQSRHSDSFDKAKKAGRINTYGMEKRANGMELEFQLVLKAEYNKGEEIELADKYAQKIKKFLNLLLGLKEGLDSLTQIDKINSGHKASVKAIGKIGGKLFKTPIIGSLDYPALSIGGKWQAAINSETNEVYTDGKLMLRFNPLLKGDVSVDIIAAASYVPLFGQAVKAIELALNASGAELNFLLTIFGQVNVEYEYALAQKGGSNLNLNGELGLKLTLSGKVKVSLNAVIFSINGEVQAEAYAVTSIKPKASIGHDKKGTFLEAKCDFMGINIVCIVTAKGKNNQVQYKDTYNLLERKDEFVKFSKHFISSDV
ncbi:hypothetical protein LUD75_18925 [Epilithonimonas sp. JDS]|uniref:hypothetical protein n=1 Tax=Epilithonimonas sp. JDS TaxID=2902797 RepID=UPI001E3884A5|nr:hypothetical protein [Epilithonimonas sp. JDS]MCD9856805.1 hypothetical protein [Epilithonimonas sp. JDS]